MRITGTVGARRVALRLLAAVLLWLALAATAAAQSNAPARAQTSTEQNTEEQTVTGLENPIGVLMNAGSLLSEAAGADGAAQDQPQEARRRGLSTYLSVMLLMTVLTLAPAIVIMCTSFTRIVIVLALLRQAIGTQSLPPGQVITGLALFMTFMIMAPVGKQVYDRAIVPLEKNQIDEHEAWQRAKQPLRRFMFDQIDHARNWDDVYMILNYRGVDTSRPETLTEDDVDMITLVPAFMLSELKVAFLMGFRLYLPFLIIDMVVASVLISMGMLMLPPVLVSLPFKLLMFVLVDGWRLVVGNLFNSFAIPGVTIALPGAG